MVDFKGLQPAERRQWPPPAKTNAWRSAMTAADSLQRTFGAACRGNAAARCTHTQTLSIYMCKQLQDCNMIQIHEACIM